MYQVFISKMVHQLKKKKIQNAIYNFQTVLQRYLKEKEVVPQMMLQRREREGAGG